MDRPENNHALQEAQETFSQLGPIRDLTEELRTFPISLLRQICDEHAKRGEPVPDHLLTMPPYIGETVLRALLEGGLVERVNDQRFAIHAYVPSEQGRAMIGRIDGAQGKVPRRRRGTSS